MKPTILIIGAGMRDDQLFITTLEAMGDAVVLVGMDCGRDDQTIIARRGDDGYFEGIMSGRIPNPLMQLRAEPTKPEPFKPFTRLREEKAQWKHERRGRR